jgi:hypothetical protein
MDMVCLTCGEPWDMDYVLHEAPHEFTRHHSRIDRCPACPATGRPALSEEEQERLEMIATIAEVYGEDIDTFVTELEDLGLV